MERLIEQYQKLLARTPVEFCRGLMNKINWNSRLIGIKGARGTGKTTLMLQYIKMQLSSTLEESLYVSLDNIYFSANTLSDLADQFVKSGGRYLFLDEVHKYPNWSQELKNLYDLYPDLKIVFTGSSLLEILNARADLSRRSVIYTLDGLSFREYVNIEQSAQLKAYTLEEILENHPEISSSISEQIKPLKYFSDYLKHGYYPFYREEKELYQIKIREIINMMLEIELPLLRKVDVTYIPKIKQLIYIISNSVPFIPNTSKIAEKIGIQRVTLLGYLNFLDEIKITKNLFKDAHGVTLLQKPQKIYLENTNLMYALNNTTPEKGNIRETFFANQLSSQHHLTYSKDSDFLINEKYTFEVGGKNKGEKQIKDIQNSYIAADEIEIGYKNKIPLWLFGFLY